jgi:hypothetical protein
MFGFAHHHNCGADSRFAGGMTRVLWPETSIDDALSWRARHINCMWVPFELIRHLGRGGSVIMKSYNDCIRL